MSEVHGEELVENRVSIYKSIEAYEETCILKYGNESLSMDEVSISSMTVCNTSAINITINLYLKQYIAPARNSFENPTINNSRAVENTLYLLKNFTIRVGETLILDHEDLKYDSDEWELYLITGALLQTADVKIVTQLINKNDKSNYDRIKNPRDGRIVRYNPTGSATDGTAASNEYNPRGTETP